MRSTVLITGGSGGIGRAVCLQIAAKGFLPIVGYCSDRHSADEIALNTGGYALFVDFADAVSIDAAASKVADLGILMGVVLAASPSPVLGPFGQIDPNDAFRQWQINVSGPQRMLQTLIRSNLQKRKAGVIVGVLTAAMATQNKPAARGMGAYIVAKYGQAGLLDVIAAEYPWLRVKSVHPSYTRTDMLKIFDPRFLEMYEAENKILSPEDVATDIMRELDL